MGEDEDFGHYVPLFRRIIILVAVITAIPVVLWTITALSPSSQPFPAAAIIIAYSPDT